MAIKIENPHVLSALKVVWNESNQYLDRLAVPWENNERLYSSKLIDLGQVVDVSNNPLKWNMFIRDTTKGSPFGSFQGLYQPTPMNERPGFTTPLFTLKLTDPDTHRKRKTLVQLRAVEHYNQELYEVLSASVIELMAKYLK